MRSSTVFTVYQCRSTYVQDIGARINVRIQVLYLQDIGAELTCVFGYFIYSVSVQNWHMCVLCLINNESITLSRSQFVLARRASVAERITRWLGSEVAWRDYAAWLAEDSAARGACAGENIWLGSLRGVCFGCLICAAGAYAVICG